MTNKLPNLLPGNTLPSPPTAHFKIGCGEIIVGLYVRILHERHADMAAQEERQKREDSVGGRIKNLCIRKICDNLEYG